MRSIAVKNVNTMQLVQNNMFYIEKITRKNGRKFQTVATLNEIEDVIFYMQLNKLEYAGTPYIFTHINLSDGSRIRQTVDIGGSEVITSPAKLRDILEGVELAQKKLM